MDQNTLKKLHNVLFEILNEFVRICEENALTYFLIDGTLLGAVRHKGFIPWDDDVDIGMPRVDYEKFILIYDNSEKANYYLLSYKTENTLAGRHYRNYAKLCKKGTVFAEKGKEPSNYAGIFIDIFPFDNCISFLAPLQTRLIQFVLTLYHMKLKMMPENKVKLVLGKLMCFFLSLSLIDKLLTKLYTLFNKSETRYISFFSGYCGCKRETQKRKTFFPLSKVSFEERYYYAPGNCDAYLTHFYGNYMELPPVEDRKSHEPLFIKFENVPNQD
jgi:lipopolysaccharide cholinephosphotransferase